MAGTFNPGGFNASPTNIINKSSSGSAACLVGTQYPKIISSGALTANTYKEVLSVSNPGVVYFCAVKTLDATSRTLGLKIVIDSVTVFDAVGATVAANNAWMYGIGEVLTGGTGQYSSQPVAVPFKTLSVSIKSSITETDKIALGVNYYTGVGNSGINLAPSSIQNYHSDGGVATTTSYEVGGQAILIGACSADTYKEVLSVTDSGIVSMCAVMANASATYTMGLKIVIDGVTAFDAVSSSTAQTNGQSILYGIGLPEIFEAYVSTLFTPMPFHQSLSVSIKNSTGTTDRCKLLIVYHTT
jgi:hypothetical protein